MSKLDLGLRILQELADLGIKPDFLGKFSNVKKAFTGGKPTFFKPDVLETFRAQDGNFSDALKLMEDEAKYVVNATDAEKMAFLNNLSQYKSLGGPPKSTGGITALDQAKNLTDQAKNMQTSIDDLLGIAKKAKDEAEAGKKKALQDLDDFLETGGQPLKKKNNKFLGGSIHEEGQIRTGVREFLKTEFKNGRLKLDDLDKERIMQYSPMIEHDPILVFKKIYGEDAYKKAGSFPGAFEKGENYKHYEKIFRENMGDDILKVKDEKYKGDGKLILTEQEEVFKPTPDDDDIPFAEGGIAGYYTGGMVDVEPNLSDIGHGSDALMARTRLVSPNSQATTSTGLNYLLAEDNDNIRVPFENGGDFKQFQKEKMMQLMQEYQQYLKNREIEKRQRPYMEKRMGTGPGPILEAAEGGRIGFSKGNVVAKGLASLMDLFTNKKMFRSKDDVPTSGFSEKTGPITIEDMINIPEDELRKIRRTQELGLYDETPEILKAGNLFERFTKKVGGERVIDYDRAEFILNRKLKGNETLNDLLQIEYQTRPGRADGGRIGFSKGKIAKEVLDKGRRGFMKAAGAAGAGIAALKTGLLGFGEKAAPVVEKAVETVSTKAQEVPPYFFNLVKKIKNLGEDTLASQDKANAYKYKDYVMEEDFAGNITIIKKNMDDMYPEEVIMSYKVDDVSLPSGKGMAKVDEYEEFTVKPDFDGKMKDVEGGVPDEVVQEGTIFEDNIKDFGKADGGLAKMLGE